MLAAVILAAGASARMGGQTPKQLLPLGGTSLLRRALDTARAVPVDQVVVVLGYQAERMLPELEGANATVVLNNQWAEGLSTSLRGGLAAVGPDARGVFIYPADMPYITADVLRQLQARQQTTGRPASMAEVKGLRMVPVYVTRSLFPALMIQEGDTGGAHYLRAHPDLVAAVPFDETLRLERDVDRPEDYRRVVEEIEDEQDSAS